MQRLLALCLLCSAFQPFHRPLFADSSSVQQSPAQFRARLSTVPIDVAMQSTIAGRGVVTATLTGTSLTVSGEFTDLKTPATTVRLHASPNKGIRGAAIAELTATTRTSGTISGVVELTAQQIGDLKKGLLYIQLQSQKAPDGNLWGWLLPKEVRR
jgi:hypothetical protein